MTIGRSDERVNPWGPTAPRGRALVVVSFAEPIWASGHVPHQQAGHMTAIAPRPEYSAKSTLASRGRPHMDPSGAPAGPTGLGGGAGGGRAGGQGRPPRSRGPAASPAAPPPAHPEPTKGSKGSALGGGPGAAPLGGVQGQSPWPRRHQPMLLARDHRAEPVGRVSLHRNGRWVGFLLPIGDRAEGRQAPIRGSRRSGPPPTSAHNLSNICRICAGLC